MTRLFQADLLVIATHNEGKLQEFQNLFGVQPFQIKSAADYHLPSPAETGTTFLENALLKARFTAEETGQIAMADDSGLCIDALDGAPGVYSADWAEKPDGTRDFMWAIQKIETNLGGIKNAVAAFHSVIVLAFPDGHYEYVHGIAKGHLTFPPRGTEGHGYDPIFIPDGYDCTYAEMTLSQKNKISHRAIAFEMMLQKCFPSP